jgi:hypothetical protein
LATIFQNFSRYIELDVWEPDVGGQEPVIFNGGTLTSKLAVGEVLEIISELAFERTRCGGFFHKPFAFLLISRRGIRQSWKAIII